MTDRIPVENITIDAEPDEFDGRYVLRGPNGITLAFLTADELTNLGIPVPTPPFEDPLDIGLTEDDCEFFVAAREGYAAAKVGRALLAAGYVPRAER